MIKPELYNKTVNILVDAYFNDTLEHGNCYACAVGNIIAANCSILLSKADIPHEHRKIHWLGYAPYSDWNRKYKRGISDTAVSILDGKDFVGNDEILSQIKSTGYSYSELTDIEFAFESCSWVGDKMFNGLMAVIDVLDQIHENNDTDLTTETKLKFKKQIA